MSTWIVGRSYDYYGRRLTCTRRWFERDGRLEMVELQDDVVLMPDGSEIRQAPFVRTGLALAPCVLPRVTETVGGVYADGYSDEDDRT